MNLPFEEVLKESSIIWLVGADPDDVCGLYDFVGLLVLKDLICLYLPHDVILEVVQIVIQKYCGRPDSGSGDWPSDLKGYPMLGIYHMV